MATLLYFAAKVTRTPDDSVPPDPGASINVVRGSQVLVQWAVMGSYDKAKLQITSGSASNWSDGELYELDSDSKSKSRTIDGATDFRLRIFDEDGEKEGEKEVHIDVHEAGEVTSGHVPIHDGAEGGKGGQAVSVKFKHELPGEVELGEYFTLSGEVEFGVTGTFIPEGGKEGGETEISKEGIATLVKAEYELENLGPVETSGLKLEGEIKRSSGEFSVKGSLKWSPAFAPAVTFAVEFELLKLAKSDEGDFETEGPTIFLKQEGKLEKEFESKSPPGTLKGAVAVSQAAAIKPKWKSIVPKLVGYGLLSSVADLLAAATGSLSAGFALIEIGVMTWVELFKLANEVYEVDHICEIRDQAATDFGYGFDSELEYYKGNTDEEPDPDATFSGLSKLRAEGVRQAKKMLSSARKQFLAHDDVVAFVQKCEDDGDSSLIARMKAEKQFRDAVKDKGQGYLEKARASARPIATEAVYRDFCNRNGGSSVGQRGMRDRVFRDLYGMTDGNYDKPNVSDAIYVMAMHDQDDWKDTPRDELPRFAGAKAKPRQDEREAVKAWLRKHYPTDDGKKWPEGYYQGYFTESGRTQTCSDKELDTAQDAAWDDCQVAAGAVGSAPITNDTGGSGEGGTEEFSGGPAGGGDAPAEAAGGSGDDAPAEAAGADEP